MWVYALWRFADRKLSIPIITPSNSLLNVLLPSLQHPSLTYSTWYHRPKSRNWSHHITPHTSVLLISMYHTSFGSSRHINLYGSEPGPRRGEKALFFTNN